MEEKTTVPGVIYSRRPRGHKLAFIIGGPSLEEAPRYINWDNIEKAGLIVEWHGANGQVVIINRNS